MWVSIVLALISFFLTSRATGGDKKKAALAALGVGAASYYAVSNTEWGKTAAENFNSTLGITSDPAIQGQVDSTAAAGNLTVANKPAGSTAWDVLKSWGATGTALVAGAVGVSTGAVSGTSWLLVGGLALGAFLLLK